MFFSAGHRRLRNLTVMTGQSLSDFSKDCLVGALLYWILFLPPIATPLLSAAFLTQQHLAIQSVFVLIYLCATRIPVQVAQSAKQMIERSLQNRRFNETKRIINSMILMHILIALVLLAILLFLVDSLLCKRLANIIIHDREQADILIHII